MKPQQDKMALTSGKIKKRTHTKSKLEDRIIFPLYGWETVI